MLLSLLSPFSLDLWPVLCLSQEVDLNTVSCEDSNEYSLLASTTMGTVPIDYCWSTSLWTIVVAEYDHAVVVYGFEEIYSEFCLGFLRADSKN